MWLSLADRDWNTSAVVCDMLSFAFVEQTGNFSLYDIQTTKIVTGSKVLKSFCDPQNVINVIMSYVAIETCATLSTAQWDAQQHE